MRFTQAGRVVYRRAKHLFSIRDALHIVVALNNIYSTSDPRVSNGFAWQALLLIAGRWYNSLLLRSYTVVELSSIVGAKTALEFRKIILDIGDALDELSGPLEKVPGVGPVLGLFAGIWPTWKRIFAIKGE